MEDQDPSEVAFQVRVDILAAKPPLWRRLVVPADLVVRLPEHVARRTCCRVVPGTVHG